LRYALERQGDLSSPLGYPGGSCQVIERIDSQVSSPKTKEVLIQKIEEGHPDTELDKKETAAIYQHVDVERGAPGTQFKWIALTRHAQYRMDLRGITMGDLIVFFASFHKAYSKAKESKSPVFRDWDRAYQRAQEIEWVNKNLVVRFIVAKMGGKSGVQVNTAFWMGGSRPSAVERSECDAFTGWAPQTASLVDRHMLRTAGLDDSAQLWAPQKPDASQVAARYANSQEWLQWISLPWTVLKKHHRKFVDGPLDDASDAILRDLAPELVRGIIEQEIDEDVQEYLEGAQEGRFEALAGQFGDPEPGNSADYGLGYAWGYANAQGWDGKKLPSSLKRRVVQDQLKEFKGEITEQVVIAALEKAWSSVSPKEIFLTVMRAVKQHGWKIGLVYGIGEIIENLVIPAALSALTGVPVPPGSLAWLPLNDIVFAAIVKRLGRAGVDDFDEDGHLDWYEGMYGPIRIAALVGRAASLGDCYEANGRWFTGNNKPGMEIVHGEVRGQGTLDGVQYGHCWIEDGSTVIDFSNGRTLRMPKAAYYALGSINRIGNFHSYTSREFTEKILDTEHWGPWDLKTSTGY